LSLIYSRIKIFNVLYGEVRDSFGIRSLISCIKEMGKDCPHGNSISKQNERIHSFGATMTCIKQFLLYSK